MKKDLLKKLGKSVLRILTALLIILGIPALAYWLWQPGKADFKFHCDHWNNAIWLGHGWLGDDSWFLRNKRNKDNFRIAGDRRARLEKMGTRHCHLLRMGDGQIQVADLAKLYAVKQSVMCPHPFSKGSVYNAGR